MTTCAEHLADGPIAGAVAWHDDDKHGFRAYLAERDADHNRYDRQRDDQLEELDLQAETEVER